MNFGDHYFFCLLNCEMAVSTLKILLDDLDPKDDDVVIKVLYKSLSDLNKYWEISTAKRIGSLENQNDMMNFITPLL